MADRILILGGIFLFALLLTQVFTTPLTSASAESRRRLRRRIEQLSTQVVITEQISLARHNYLQSLRPFERWLESWPVLRPLVRLIEQAGLQMPAYRLVLLGLGGALIALLIMPLFTSKDFFVLVVAVIAGLAPWIWLNRQKSQRLLKFEEALAMLARTLRAGLPLSQALQIVSQEMTGPVGQEFGIVFNELNYGGDLRSAFMAMLERIPSVVVMALAVAIMIQRETGGNLAVSVDSLERLMRERSRFQRHLRSLTASNRTSAWIVGMIPFLLAAVLELLSPGYLATLTDHPTGNLLLYAGLAMQATGAVVIWRMIRIDV